MSTAGSGVAARLLRWFDAAKRDLPWRRTRDPWAIWVSEVMLQQTRVEAVREPFRRFVERYPTPAAWAAVGDDELLQAWRGLGYYRRARLLREGARTVVAQHGGNVPPAPEQLAELPGIGSYTLGAVASIAFGALLVAIDGNVERVTARHRGIDAVLGTAKARAAIRAAVEAWLDRRRPGDFNQALMELGATVCTPSSPRCGECPLHDDCFACANAVVDRLPTRKAKPSPVAVESRVALALRGGCALGFRIPDGQINAGQVELAGPGVLADCTEEDLAAAVHRRFGAALRIGPLLATVRHAITCHRITLRAHTATVDRVGTLHWFDLGDATPWTTPSRKVFLAALGDGSRPDAAEA